MTLATGPGPVAEGDKIFWSGHVLTNLIFYELFQFYVTCTMLIHNLKQT